MISIEDCIAMCGLSPTEVEAVAEHEHIPEVAASALASYLLRRAGGADEIRAMLVDDIRTALAENRLRHASELFMALRHFLAEHPEAAAKVAAE